MSSDARSKAMDLRVRGELVDSFDEELEMEIDDERLKELVNEFAERPDPGSMDRTAYFKELFRLQGELGRVLSAPRKGAVSQWGTVPPGKGRSSR